MKWIIRMTGKSLCRQKRSFPTHNTHDVNHLVNHDNDSNQRGEKRPNLINDKITNCSEVTNNNHQIIHMQYPLKSWTCGLLSVAKSTTSISFNFVCQHEQLPCVCVRWLVLMHRVSFCLRTNLFGAKSKLIDWFDRIKVKCLRYERLETEQPMATTREKGRKTNETPHKYATIAIQRVEG